MFGFADESYNHAAATYIVGAVLIPAAQLPTVRKSAVAVLQPGRKWNDKPFHWRKEAHGRKLGLLVDTVLGYNLKAYSVTAGNVTPGDEEVARVVCLEALILQIAADGAIGLTIDSRNESQVKIDRQTMIDFRKRGILPRGFGYGFEYPNHEPALWIADALAGATYAELGGDPQYTAALGSQLDRVP